MFRSPLQWADEISDKVPLLIMHGTADWRVDLEHSLKMATKLYNHNKPFRLKIYEGGDHSIREHQGDVVQEILNWFDNYLLKNKQPPNLEKHGV
ncbi:MAG: prolyl oligopeptidase family serine peptidase [Thermales bacterium]|nr:prolyl oligopeptidase family serine peptidase [Thermales bacterium]